MTPIQQRFAAETELWEATDHRQRVAAKRRQRMRSLLLNSALRLMLEKTDASPSIDEIISAARVSRGTFYKYFPSSDAIVLIAPNELVDAGTGEIDYTRSSWGRSSWGRSSWGSDVAAWARSSWGCACTLPDAVDTRSSWGRSSWGAATWLSKWDY